MPSLSCNVCLTALEDKLFESDADQSLTSLCQVVQGATRVYACHRCGHLQTPEMADSAAYYESDYDILVNSEEEDQIYELRGDGAPLYRTEHQVNVLMGKVNLPAGAALLDYGCAKSSTIKALLSKRSDVVPHLFDVSARYIPFWDKFVQPSNWAVNEVQAAWKDHFDLVTSFFSLEHMVRPADSLRQIAGVLKPGGVFYGVVPNVLTNIADFIVLDHVNHFSDTSLHYLLSQAGFDEIVVDDQAHRGAFVFTARKRAHAASVASGEDFTAAVAGNVARFKELAAFWQKAGDQIRVFEQSGSAGADVAIYGAGFYGAFIAANLRRPDKIRCHLDQNVYLQGRSMNGHPILSPADLPSDICTVLVGLNPAHARRLIAEISSLASRDLNYFYLG